MNPDPDETQTGDRLQMLIQHKQKLEAMLNQVKGGAPGAPAGQPGHPGAPLKDDEDELIYENMPMVQKDKRENQGKKVRRGGVRVGRGHFRSVFHGIKLVGRII